MNDSVPHRNLSPHGWWVATYIIRAEQNESPNQPPNSHCLAWENTIILKAPDRESAYNKAIAFGSQDSGEFWDSNNRTMHWVFEGLTELLPIYDELEDGAEIMWVEHQNRTVRKIRSLVRPKEILTVFDDTP